MIEGFRVKSCILRREIISSVLAYYMTLNSLCRYVSGMIRGRMILPTWRESSRVAFHNEMERAEKFRNNLIFNVGHKRKRRQMGINENT